MSKSDYTTENLVDWLHTTARCQLPCAPSDLRAVARKLMKLQRDVDTLKTALTMVEMYHHGETSVPGGVIRNALKEIEEEE